MGPLFSYLNKETKPLIDINKNISDALKLLNQNDIKTLFVIKKKGKSNIYCGTITDGDIRRFLIKKINLEKKIKFVFKKKSKFLFYDDKDFLSKARLIYNKSLINIIPILSKNYHYLGYVNCDQIINILDKKKEKKLYDLFIMAGGFGKRLRPLTYTLPKPLIEVNGTNMISRIINSASSQSVDKIFVSLYYKSSLIKKYINQNFQNKNIIFLIEKKPLGTAGSISMLKKYKAKNNFLLMNADISSNIDFNSFFKFHSQNKSDLTICSSKYKIDVPFGVMQNDGKKIKKFLEKPKYEFLINSGIYFMNKKILKIIKKNTYLDLNHLVAKAIENKLKVMHYPMYEQWIDIGSKKDLNKARKILKN